MKYKLDQISELPEYAGIYVVYSGEDQVIYVGQAQNIRKRWLNHEKKPLFDKDYPDARIEPVELLPQYLNRAENLAYLEYKPILNVNTPSMI